MTNSLSPVTIFTVTPLSASAASAAPALSLGGSRNPAKPANTSSASSPTTAWGWSSGTRRQAMPNTRKPSFSRAMRCPFNRPRAGASRGGWTSFPCSSYRLQRAMISSDAPLTTSNRSLPFSTRTDTRRRSKSNGTSSIFFHALTSMFL